MVVGKIRTDSVKNYGWFQTLKYGDVMKTLNAKGTLHTAAAHGIDNFFTTGKPVLKQQKTLPATKYNNKLLADMIALRLNIVASAMGKTPVGFGELIYDDGTANAVNGLMVKEIADVADSVMMGWQVDSTYMKGTKSVTVKVHKFADPGMFADIGTAVAKIDSAFEGPVDTVAFADSLRFKGSKSLVDIAYLYANPSVMPMRIVPMAGVTVAQDPVSYALYQNYPNPFNPTTTIQFELPTPALVTLKIYNLLGQEVVTLLDRQDLEDGTQEVTFDGGNLASGVYFYRIIAEGVDEDGMMQSFTQVKKMMLIK